MASTNFTLTDTTAPMSIRDKAQCATVISTIKSYADLPAPISPESIRQFVSLDNELYPILLEEKRWFFAHIGEHDAIQFARDLHVLHGVAAKTLEQLFDRRGEWSQSDIDPLLIQLIALALYHHGAAVKWGFFQHETVKPTLWPELHALYRFAETHVVANAPVTLFSQETQYQTTILALYLRVLLLEVLNTGSLTMRQTEIADGWLADWTPEYVLDATYAPRTHPLFVDLDAMAGMQLVTGNTARPSHRYMRIEGLKEQLESARSYLRTGQAYCGRGAPNDFPMEEYVALLATIERLYSTLMQASAARIEQRRQVSNLIAEVRLGFEVARAAIAGEPDAPEVKDGPPTKFGGLELTLDDNPGAAPNAAGSKRWKVQDMSSRGMGLLVDRSTGDGISVGQLMALKPDGFAHYLLGVIVRKLTQRAVGETLLGVEILSYRPLPITLHRYVQVRDEQPDPDALPIAALYLPGPGQDGKSDIVVLPGGDFGLKNVFNVPTTLESFRLRINRVLRKGTDWVGLRFEVIGKH